MKGKKKVARECANVVCVAVTWVANTTWARRQEDEWV